MIETLQNLRRPRYFVADGPRRFLFLLFPYRPFSEGEGALVDAYYPASNAGYHEAKALSESLSAQGIANRFSPDVDYKRVLARADEAFFVGENTLLFHRDFGSRFCIEAIELFEPVPARDCGLRGCASCGKCRRVCPTGAIGAGSFDRRKCLREIMNHPETFTDEIAQKIGRRLFGCDLCQRVCPHNAGEAEIPNPFQSQLSFPFLLSAGKRELAPLEPLLGMNYLRPKRIQNLTAVGAGNSGDRSLLPHLFRLLEERSAPGREKERDPVLEQNVLRAIASLERLKNSGVRP